MPVENQLGHVIGQTENEARYDKATKKLLANKIVLAHIMKGCVQEYQNCTVEEIAEKYIEGTPEVGSAGVHVDDTNRETGDMIHGSNTEDSTLTEGTIYYDVRFDAVAPRAKADGQEERICLIVNVEAQNKFNPGYPLVKRAVYYCSRLISAQRGSVFGKSEYGKIKKVYSIWVCTRPPEKFENTITRYAIQPETIVGNAVETSDNYDLLSAVMVCLGKPGTKNYAGVLKFLEVLLSSRAAEEKKKILTEDFGVAMTETLEQEVREMCNLSQGVKAEGIQQGIAQGIQKGLAEGIEIGEVRMLVKQVRKGRLTLEQAAEDAGMTVEQFKAVLESTPLTL